MTRNKIVHVVMLTSSVVSIAVVTRGLLNSQVELFDILGWITMMEVGFVNVLLHSIVAIWLRTFRFIVYLVSVSILTIPVYLWAEEVVEWQDRNNLDHVKMVLNSGLSDSQIREELDIGFLGGGLYRYYFETDSSGKNVELNFPAPSGFVHAYFFQDSVWTYYD